MSRKTRFGRRATTAASASSLSRGRAGAVALVLQDAGDQLADIRLIVDDQDVGCHDQTAIVLLSADAAGAVGRRGSAQVRDKAQLHPGAARARNLLRRVVQLDAPAVLFENAPDDGEPEARCPSRAWSRRARAGARGFPSAVRCHCRSRRSRPPCRRGARETAMRPRPSSAGGTAPIASVAFLMMLVSACEISRRSKRAGIDLRRQLDLEIDVRHGRRASGRRPGARCRRDPRRRSPASACARSGRTRRPCV